MIKAYFFSDIHLGAEESAAENEKQKIFLQFINEIQKDATHICIVGDLFDFWFEYKYVVPKKYFEILYHLKKLTEKGIETHYLAGNHDFYLGHFFDQYLNIKTYQDECILDIAGKKFYLWHGDGLGKKDGGYRLLKKIVRNRVNQRIFKFLHPDFGIPLARKISGSSRKYTNQLNHLRDESDYVKFAEKQFEKGFDYVMLGHRHNPLEHKNGNKKYLNLGDWIENFTYAVFNGETLELKYFKESKEKKTI